MSSSHRVAGSGPATVSGLYYGWIIVATLCATETITWGIIYYGFPVFLSAMERDLALLVSPLLESSQSVSQYPASRAYLSGGGSIGVVEGFS